MAIVGLAKTARWSRSAWGVKLAEELKSWTGFHTHSALVSTGIKVGISGREIEA